MVGQRRRRWADIKSELAECIVLAGIGNPARTIISSPHFDNLPKQDILAGGMLQFNKHSNAFCILFTKVCLIVNNNL